MMEKSFLIVEDDEALARGLARWLALSAALEEKAWAGAVIDISLPDSSGFEVLELGTLGATRAEIATSRGKTQATIKTQIASLKKKTKDRTLRHAVVRVLREAAQREL